MMKKHKLLKLFLVLMFFGGLLFVGNAPGLAAETYKIGVIQAFSGVFSVYGEETYPACEIAVDKVNAGGGVLGRKMELFKRDTKAQPDTAVRATQDLINRDKIDALLGGTGSGELLGALEVTREHKVIHLSSSSNAEKANIERIHPYFFQMTPNTYMEASSAARALANHKFNTYVTIALDYEWGHANVETFNQIIKEVNPNAKNIGEYWPPLKEVDFSSYITAILNKKPDLVYGVFVGGTFQTFIRQARGYRFFEKVKYHCQGMEPDLMALKEEFPEGQRIYSRGAWYAIKNPEMDAFRKEYVKRTGREPGAFAILAYDNILALAESIKRAGSFDRDAIAKALATGKHKTLRGELYFRPLDHQMNSPMYFSTSYFDKKRGYCIGKDILIVPGEKTWRSEEETKKLRAEKGIKFTPWSEKK
ncbi:MAG TPA: ABC transporter substrate-binding protein [Syntrophorhabdus sp.]|nr:ABC transporter substrate-binding protein [Syntrophorhabdus sp.]